MCFISSKMVCEHVLSPLPFHRYMSNFSPQAPWAFVKKKKIITSALICLTCIVQGFWEYRSSALRYFKERTQWTKKKKQTNNSLFCGNLPHYVHLNSVVRGNGSGHIQKYSYYYAWLNHAKTSTRALKQWHLVVICNNCTPDSSPACWSNSNEHSLTLNRTETSQ